MRPTLSPEEIDEIEKEGGTVKLLPRKTTLADSLSALALALTKAIRELKPTVVVQPAAVQMAPAQVLVQPAKPAAIHFHAPELPETLPCGWMFTVIRDSRGEFTGLKAEPDPQPTRVNRN